jgi:hypothetical protein
MKSLGGVECKRRGQGGCPAFVLVALLVGCSSGSGTTSAGGGAGGGAGSGGETGGAAGSAAGATGTPGSGGATGTGGSGGAGEVGGAGGGGGGSAGVGGRGGGGTGGVAGGNGGAGAAGSGAAGSVDAGTHATDAGCQGVDLSGSGVPAGTVATASSFGDSSDAPAGAIDGDLTTQWSTGTFNGWITLTFPTPVMISAIRIHAEALPETNEIYTVATNTSTSPLGSANLPVTLSPGSVLPDIQVTPGMYSNITITVDAGASWVGVDEIWLLSSPACP